MRVFKASKKCDHYRGKNNSSSINQNINKEKKRKRDSIIKIRGSQERKGVLSLNK
jgi:invasion protein IalB